MVNPSLQPGDGVRIPWGLDTVKGEVIDLVPLEHVLVEVPVEDASGAVIDHTTVRMNVQSVTPLPRWRVLKSRAGSPSPGADAARAWWIDAVRDGDTASVEVRLSGTLAASSRRPPEAERAIRTQGRSAIDKFARRFRLPRVIVVGSNGVFELADDEAAVTRAAAARHEQVERAMDRWFRAEGWSVERTQAGGFPYDLIARREGEVVYCEVKAESQPLTPDAVRQTVGLLKLIPSVTAGAVRYALAVGEAGLTSSALGAARKNLEVYLVQADDSVKRLA